MDGKILAESLVVLDQTTLRYVYALLFKIDLRRTLLPRLKGTEIDSKFLSQLKMEADKLADEPDGKLQVGIFLEMANVLKLTGERYDHQEAIEKTSGEIVEAVYQLLRDSEPNFKAFSQSAPVPGKIHQLLLYELIQLFSNLGKNPAVDMEILAAELAGQLSGLPAEKQTSISAALGKEALTETDIAGVLSADGIAPLYKAIVEADGYSFIPAVKSILSKMPDRFNLLRYLPILIGEGKFLALPQNRTLKKRLLPAVLLQVVLPSVADETGRSISFKPFIAAWKKQYAVFVEVYDKFKQVKEAIAEVEGELEANKLTQRYLTDEIELAKELASYEKQKIRLDLMNRTLDRLPYISDAFYTYKIEFEELQQTASQLNGKEEVTAKGFRGRLSNAILNFSAAQELRELRKEAEEALDNMAEEVLLSDSPYKAKERENARRYTEKLEVLIEEREEAIRKREDLEDELQALRFSYHDRLDEVKKAAKTTYGFEDLVPEL